MPDVLIVADTVRSPELRHEAPLPVPDPFLYAEVDGKRSVVVGSTEASRIEELGTGLEVLTYEDVGVDELLKRGLDADAHERPGVGRIEGEPLVEGDVIALEPGLYRNGYGGVRLEDRGDFEL